MTKRFFTLEELDRNLESLDHYWHRHGSEEQQIVEDFIRALYEAVPEDRRGVDFDVSSSTIVSFSPSELGREVTVILKGVYSEDEVKADVSLLSERIVALGGVLEGEDELRVGRGIFRRVFEDVFDQMSMAQSLDLKMSELEDKISGLTPDVPAVTTWGLDD